MSKASNDILAERQRQIDFENWTPEHDDLHTEWALSKAARCYTNEHNSAGSLEVQKRIRVPDIWPWDAKWWKPKTYRENLVRAGALIIAEIERLDRKEYGLL